MATVNVSVTRQNGMQIHASGEVADSEVVLIAQRLAGILKAQLDAPASTTTTP